MKKIPGKDLPDPDHVVRHVPWTKLHRDEDGDVLGVLGEAFAPRPSDNSALSVNWLEFYDGDWKTKIEASVNAFRASRMLDGKKVGSRSDFAVGNVAKIKSICSTSSRAVRIIFAPSRNNPSHSVIRTIPSDDMTLLDALATEGIMELVRNSDIP